MGYQVPAHRKSKGQNKFEFGPKTGEEFSVPRANLLTIGQLEQLEQADEAVKFFGPAGTPQGDYIRSLHREEFGALIKAWTQDSGVTLGESGASGS